EQLGDLVFLGVEQLRGERRLESVSKADIEERVERIDAALGRDLGDTAAFERAVRGLGRDRDLDAVPGAVEEPRGARAGKVVARGTPECGIGVDARQLGGIVALR